MDLVVTISQIYDIQEYVSKKDGKVFRKFSFVGKTNEQYSKTIYFTCLNENLWSKFNLAIGSQYQVSFDVSSKEWNGKWFTEATCWRVVPTVISQSNSNQRQQVQQPQTQSQVEINNDDVPF